MIKCIKGDMMINIDKIYFYDIICLDHEEG